MPYRLSAECVLAAHFAFICLAVFGGLSVLRRRALALPRRPAAGKRAPA
ncbi:MAG: hypothetical protein BWX69_02500 [Planctomycetes bacterium ADurb.Bin069]|jgi:hypothetical protein|nr:MAG: hypothetical protein BWX69_02500 [Planctomycetes bacterium ADurb.Bin069]